MFYVIYPDLWKFSIKKWRLARRRRPLWSQWRPHCGFGNFGWNFKILELFSENFKVMKNFEKYWVIISKVGSSWFHRFRKCYWKQTNIFLVLPQGISMWLCWLGAWLSLCFLSFHFFVFLSTTVNIGRTTFIHYIRWFRCWWRWRRNGRRRLFVILINTRSGDPAARGRKTHPI